MFGLKFHSCTHPTDIIIHQMELKWNVLAFCYLFCVQFRICFAILCYLIQLCSLQRTKATQTDNAAVCEQCTNTECTVCLRFFSFLFTTMRRKAWKLKQHIIEDRKWKEWKKRAFFVSFLYLLLLHFFIWAFILQCDRALITRLDVSHFVYNIHVCSRECVFRGQMQHANPWI